MKRKSEIKRKTKETNIVCNLLIEGSGKSQIKSGNAFMDHMLVLFSKHGNFDLKLYCKGDIDVDFHHSAEDIGICMGQAFYKALGDFRGISRFGTSHVPMDESLARVCVDISGRPNLVYNVKLSSAYVKDFECDLAHDFFKAFCDHARMTIHIDLLRGRNSHHSLEAIFKAFSLALAQACSLNKNASKFIPSSKGII